MIGNLRFLSEHKSFRIIIVIFSLLLILPLAGCGSKKDRAYRNLSKDDPRNTHYKGHYKVGKEYKIKGKSYKPSHVTRYNKVGVASWYGSKNGFHKKPTANGDVYNKNLLTAAHKTLPMPSLVKVTNLANEKSVIVMINDRGPYKGNREIDVSEKAASLLDFKNKGTAKVRVQYMHSETQEFLKKLGVKKEEGAKSKRKLANNKCSVNCHIKLVNQKYKTAGKS